MPKSAKEMEMELETLRQQVRELTTSRKEEISEDDVPKLIVYLREERERTNRALEMITRKIQDMERQLNAPEEPAVQQNAELRQNKVPLSSVDVKILSFIQVQQNEMACADDVCKHMGYNGRNAASARLNRLHNQGLLERFQLGHTVYYKFDAGKTTTTLIVSPPQ